MSTPQKQSALVIGGGIAGMQASLDIADAGYPVYLVEREPGIGGRMAQLDKTFPTLDCASCIITPKLVNVGNNPNIAMRTYCEVASVSGGPGDFHVTVHHKPRYVDVDRCVGCSLCADACPVPVDDAFNMDLVEQRAAYRLFAQVVPNAFCIHREGRAPCRDACPASQRVPGYIALIRERRYDEAMKSIKLDNPFPGICGRICNHRCEEVCNRAVVDEAVNIRALKRFAADQVYAQPREPVERVEPRYEERIAIVGAGPAGLTAAQDLTLAGYPVTVFEALPVAGGMVRVGVPEFRMPSDIIEREVQDIIDLGVDLRLNTRVDSVDALFDEGYAAVLAAVGAHQGVRLPIPGNDLNGIILNSDFLREVRLGDFDGRKLGRVLVLGGGNVAIDCARTAIRLGAESVAMSCLECRETMPAHSWEVEAAEAEGIQVYNDRSFLRVVDDGKGNAAGVECIDVASFSFDETGRLQVETIAGTEHVIEADTVIFAVGQRPELELVGDAELSPRRTLAADPDTLMTSREGVFTAGDALNGTTWVIDAIADGHRAAYSMHRYVRGLAGDDAVDIVDTWRSLLDIDLPIIVKTPEEVAHLAPEARINMRETHYQELPGPFAEVEAPLPEEEALAEAARCLNCGTCAECLRCVEACEALAIDHNQVAWDEELQVGAIIVATGFDMYDARRKPQLGYGKYPNVMTALEMERMLSASGPTSGKAQLPDGTVPKDVVFIQCVGSRDLQDGNPYCSRVCCMYTAKEAHLVHDRIPDARITVFYIDIRAFGKNFEEFHEHVREEGIRYRRGNVSQVIKRSDKLVVQAEDTLLGKPVEVEADLVVLATGLMPRADAKRVAELLNLTIGSDGFFQEEHPKLLPVGSGVPGIFLAGCAQGPKDILDAVSQAKAAAAAALVTLAQAEARERDLAAAAD